jgi:hypothetical protein
MKSLSRKKNSLHERLEKVEKQNRRMKSYLVFLIITLLAFAAMGAKEGPQDEHFRQITAERLTIVDAAGQELILIGSDKVEGIGIRINNWEGKKIVGIGSTANESGTGIMVLDKQGRPRIGLGMDEGVPSVALVDEKGKKFLAMGGDERGYGFVIMDENEVERAGLGYNAGNTGIMIYDDKGQYVRGMIRQQNGIHYSSYVDEKGKEIMMR